MPTVRFLERYPLSRPLVFDFFRSPANVVAVAPAGLGLRLVETPEVVVAGSRFVVEMRRWGLVQRIETQVVEVEEPGRLVEEQRQGPFRSWRVTRLLAEVEGETELVETIDWEPPGGLLGLALTSSAVERELRQAYLDRAARVLQRLRAAQ